MPGPEDIVVCPASAEDLPRIVRVDGHLVTTRRQSSTPFSSGSGRRLRRP